MRSTRALLLGAALSAALTLGASGAAFAAGVHEPKEKVTSSHDDSKKHEDGDHDDSKKHEDGRDEESKKHDDGDHAEKMHHPHGGVHAGGGSLASTGGSLTGGATLLAAGLGLGSGYVLRRRPAKHGA